MIIYAYLLAYMIILRIFIGTHVTKNKKAVSTINVMDEQSNVLTLPAKQYVDNKATYHRIQLRTIYDFANEICNARIKDKIKLIFYLNDDFIAYEWNQEYKNENKISKETKDKDIYNELIRINKKIDIVIKGKEAILASMNRIGVKK